MPAPDPTAAVWGVLSPGRAGEYCEMTACFSSVTSDLDSRVHEFQAADIAGQLVKIECISRRTSREALFVFNADRPALKAAKLR
jgi:hypothetical protein